MKAVARGRHPADTIRGFEPAIGLYFQRSEKDGIGPRGRRTTRREKRGRLNSTILEKVGWVKRGTVGLASQIGGTNSPSIQVDTRRSIQVRQARSSKQSVTTKLARNGLKAASFPLSVVCFNVARLDNDGINAHQSKFQDLALGDVRHPTRSQGRF